MNAIAMNTMLNALSFDRRRDDRRAANTSAPAIRLPHPRRDFGVGYGRSSGYAADRSYTTRAFTPLYARAWPDVGPSGVDPDKKPGTQLQVIEPHIIELQVIKP